MRERGGLNILDALENLNTLVDADSLEEIEVTDDAHLISHKEIGMQIEEYWVKAGADELTLSAIRETFRVVHVYLQTFYSRMKKNGDTRRLIEGINTIMVLVGEAAKKLEDFGTLFKKYVNEIEEYKDLQNFYKNRVIKESFREFAKVPIPHESSKEESLRHNHSALGEEIEEFLPEEGITEVAGIHLLNDLEVIKQDHHYELFYLKNEAGHPFYTYELARTIKLACDFGEFKEEYFGEDPLLQIKNWEDKSLHLRAQHLLKQCSHAIETFTKEAMKYKEMPLVALMQQALMALFLAANPRNLIRQFSLKGSHLYFQDFLLFLRQAVANREFQKFLIYSTPSGRPFFQDLLYLIHKLCYILFTEATDHTELKNSLSQLENSGHPEALLSEALLKSYHALNKSLQHHPSGPVFKAVDIIRSNEVSLFDSLHQGNIPEKEWSLLFNESEVTFIRLPSPTIQEIIGKAYVIEEFKTFLRAMDSKERLLIINYQDRTSWKEHARAVALEDLAKQAEFADVLTVITLAKDTDFYNQSGLYQHSNKAHVFIEHFMEHLSDEITGYYFPQKIKGALFPSVCQRLLAQIHTTFFGEKEELNLHERQVFIQLAYHLIELKLIDLVKPTYMSFVSKDSLDITGVTSVGFIAFVLLNNQKKWNKEELESLNVLLFGPTLMNRERIIHKERFEKLISTLSFLEDRTDNYLAPFEDMFEGKTLKADVHYRL